MKTSKVWALNLAVLVLIVAFTCLDYLTKELEPESRSFYEVYLQDETGVDNIWLLVATLILYISTIPFLIKTIWNEYISRLPNANLQ